MPAKRAFTSISVLISDGGRLLPDLPAVRVGAANLREKLNFVSELGAVRNRAGWDYPAPSGDWTPANLGTFDDAAPVEAIRGVRRPNGTYAIVACGGGLIKAFDYDTDQWVTIGAGYSAQGDTGFRWWQIEDVAGYAVFNNGRDLPCTWQIGDAAVRPLYEFREAGYAAAGGMVEYVDGVLMFHDILEINDADMAAVMTDPLPYKVITEGATTTRISFRRAWSIEGDPRGFAATVPGSIDAGTAALTLAWPMASFAEGDGITVIGAGSAGGNLATTIVTVAGTAVTVADNASTTVSAADVQKTRDLTSISGWDDIEDDGSAIVAQVPLKTQLVTFKASGNIWQTYYTGDVDTPFAKDRVGKKPSAAVRFPRAIASVNDEFLLYPGAAHFYRFALSNQGAEEDPIFAGAEKELFFSRVAGLGERDVWAADNTCTGEIFFAYLWDDYEIGYYGASRALAYNYNRGIESLSEIDGFGFTCAASVKKPLAGDACDEVEDWFLMGDGNGGVTQYGETNLDVLTRSRYGETFRCSLLFGLLGVGSDDNGKYARRFSLIGASPSASQAVEATIYGARAANDDLTALETKTLTDPRFPGCMGLFYRKPYFSVRLAAQTAENLRIAGHLWRVGVSETQDVDRLG